MRKSTGELVCGWPDYMWRILFGQCHEWTWDGGKIPLKVQKKALKTGYYHRLEWPEPGGMLLLGAGIATLLGLSRMRRR